MAWTDNEKKNELVAKINAYFSSIGTYTQLKTALQNITFAEIKTFLKNQEQGDIDDIDNNEVPQTQTKRQNKVDLKAEIDTW